jgi:hypothetical protein
VTALYSLVFPMSNLDLVGSSSGSDICSGGEHKALQAKKDHIVVRDFSLIGTPYLNTGYTRYCKRQPSVQSALCRLSTRREQLRVSPGSLTRFTQVTFIAYAPLDIREERAVSLTGETRKLTVVGNIPELGGWSLTKGITLRQYKNGEAHGRLNPTVRDCTHEPATA